MFFVLCFCGTLFVQGTSKQDLGNHISGGAARGSSSSPTLSEGRQKRAMGDYKELTDIIDELEENSLAQKASATLPVGAVPPQGQEFDLDSMPPLTYYLLLQKLRQRKLPQGITLRMRNICRGRWMPAEMCAKHPVETF